MILHLDFFALRKPVDEGLVPLLQDMARPILLHHDSSYVRLVQACGDSHAELAARERDELGWTHPEIGELLCSAWGLPESLSESISTHHDEALAGYEIAQWASLIELPELDTDLLVQEAATRLGVEEVVALGVLERAVERANEIAAVFS